MLADQLRQLFALLRQKHPPILLVAITVLSIAVSILTTLVAQPTSTAIVIERSPAPAAVATAERVVQTLPVSCNPAPNASLGVCSPRSTLAAVETSRLLAGASSLPTIHGPLCADVSSNNRHPIDWTAAAREIRCAYVKATEGRAYVNPYFRSDCASLRALRIPRAGYDFARPAPGWSGADEARHFFANAGACLGSLPSVLDVETSQLSPQATHAWVASYLTELRLLTARPDVTVYTGAWFWNPRVGAPSLGAHLWVSGYASSVVNPAGWRSHFCWQFTDGAYGPYPHIVSGIGRVDVSVCDAKLLAALDQAHAPSPAEITKRKRAAELRAARRSHVLVHAQIHARCRGRHANHHSAGCRVLFRRNAQLHARWGRALR